MLFFLATWCVFFYLFFLFFFLFFLMLEGKIQLFQKILFRGSSLFQIYLVRIGPKSKAQKYNLTFPNIFQTSISFQTNSTIFRIRNKLCSTKILLFFEKILSFWCVSFHKTPLFVINIGHPKHDESTKFVVYSNAIIF